MKIKGLAICVCTIVGLYLSGILLPLVISASGRNAKDLIPGHGTLVAFRPGGKSSNPKTYYSATEFKPYTHANVLVNRNLTTVVVSKDPAETLDQDTLATIPELIFLRPKKGDDCWNLTQGSPISTYSDPTSPRTIIFSADGAVVIITDKKVQQIPAPIAPATPRPSDYGCK